MTDSEDDVRFITFYSYKGGVGRTMALANVACQMANRHGMDVVCIDWDLEAPGLHYYFDYADSELAGRAGLLDYLLDFEQQLDMRSKGRVPDVANYIVDLKPEQAEKIRHGRVRMMHCGRTDANYMARVQGFDWDEFYEKYEGFRVVETLKRQLVDDAGAEMVLIDARAGQAEVGTTPTIQIPDAVLLLFTSNRQCLEGVNRIARELIGHPLREKLDRRLRMLLVPARVFPVEESFGRWLEEHAEPVFERLVEDGIISRGDQPAGLKGCMIPVDAKWSVQERLPILQAPTDPQNPQTPPINVAYVGLAQALHNLHRGQAAWTARSERLPTGASDETIASLRAQLDEAIERGDESDVAWRQFKLAQACILEQRLEEAEGLLQGSLTYNQRVGRQDAIASVHHEMGRIRSQQGRSDDAWSLYERALAIDQESGETREQGVTLYVMGDLRVQQDRLEDAWLLYERALALHEQAGETREQGVTLHAMGRVKLLMGQYDDAEALLRRGLEMAGAAGDEEGIAVCNEALRECRDRRQSPGEGRGTKTPRKRKRTKVKKKK